jgi:DNA-binding MarR family transcriptional regulator
MSSLPPKVVPAHVLHFDSLQQEVYLNLWRTYDRLKGLEEALFSNYGLTAQQYNALRLLRAEHPGSLPTLAIGARLISRAPDITRLINKLEERGLVERRRDAANRRLVNVAITSAGVKLLDAIASPLAECHQQQLGHLTVEQLQRLVDLLKLARQPHEEADASLKSAGS